MLSHQDSHYLRIDAVLVGSNVCLKGEADGICAEGIWDII